MWFYKGTDGPWLRYVPCWVPSWFQIENLQTQECSESLNVLFFLSITTDLRVHDAGEANRKQELVVFGAVAVNEDVVITPQLLTTEPRSPTSGWTWTSCFTSDPDDGTETRTLSSPQSSGCPVDTDAGDFAIRSTNEEFNELRAREQWESRGRDYKGQQYTNRRAPDSVEPATCETSQSRSTTPVRLPTSQSDTRPPSPAEQTSCLLDAGSAEVLFHFLIPVIIFAATVRGGESLFIREHSRINAQGKRMNERLDTDCVAFFKCHKTALAFLLLCLYLTVN